MRRHIVDGNALLNQALLRGEDKEGGRKVEFEGKQIQVNSAEFGVDGFMVKFMDILKDFHAVPRDLIVVWDGAGAKEYRRGRYLPTYKAGRDKAPEVSHELNIARDRVNVLLKGLGTTSVLVKGMEADDVIAFLVKNMRTQRNTVHSGDGDLAVLSDANTDTFIGGKLNHNPFGPFPLRFVTVYKALVGDTTDKLPGAKGFGDAAFVDLYRTFGEEGMEMMAQLIADGQIKRLKEDLADFPRLQVIMNAEAMVTASWQCAMLYPDEVNTPRRPLEWTPGMVEEYNPEVHWVELQNFYGRKKLVSAENYEATMRHFKAHINQSDFVALDIETSHCPESLEWLAQVRKKDDKGSSVDPLGSVLNGMSITYGNNGQYTFYMTVGHVEEPGITNISVDQCREMCEVIPKTMHTVIQNRNFEFTVLFQTWGEKWKDNGWYGFVPNALDTKIESSYVDENLPKGLKDQSQHYLGYRQVTYAEVTGGKQMNELTASHVMAYGCDDTICTSAVHTFYRIVMEMEQTWDTYLKVEQLPEYLTTQAYIQGTPISKTRLRELIEADDKIFNENWAKLRGYLISYDWEGAVCPTYAELTPANIKEAVEIITGEEFTTRVRKLPSVAQALREAFPDNADAQDIAAVVDSGDVEALNRKVHDNFDGEPKLNFNSPRQIQKLLYQVVGITPRIYNKLTERERADEAVSRAFNKLRKFQKDPAKVEVTEEDRAIWAKKSSTDDQAVAMALAMDDLSDEGRMVLKAYSEIKSVMTKRNLFYENYHRLQHWSDGRIHASLNQSETVTRRYSASKPNVQQLPKSAEGGGFREVYLPHTKDAVVVSLDWAGQELRLLAELSKDEAMTSCYVGDNLKDLHSLTAVEAAAFVWEKQPTYDEFIGMLESKDLAIKAKAKSLRSSSKGTNFGTNYGLQAPKLALQLMCEEVVAQQFIDAKDAAFPGINIWKDKCESAAAERGYALTLLGGRRHLSAGLSSADKWEVLRAERQASNAEIQAAGAEMCKLALARMWQRGLFNGKYRAQFFFVVHDEVVFSVHKDDAAALIKEVHECMVVKYASMTIPIESSISLGPNFGNQIEIGMLPTDEVINDALFRVFGEAA